MPPPPNRFAGRDTAVMGPVIRRVVPTLSDTVDLDEISRGIRVLEAGDVGLILDGETDPIVETFAAGELLPYRVKRVGSTGTTVAADNIRLLY